MEFCTLDNSFKLNFTVITKPTCTCIHSPWHCITCEVLTIGHRDQGPVLSACSPQLKSEENQEQCSVFSVQCPGVERAVNTGRGNVPDRPDTRRERTRRLEFNLLFIETQLEWEFEVRDGWMLDCSITWTNFMALLGWNEDKAGRVRNM